MKKNDTPADAPPRPEGSYHGNTTLMSQYACSMKTPNAANQRRLVS
jgi:hypothetical protein